MFSPLRNRFGIPGVISVIALVFAMLGGAYAASNNGGDATASAKQNKKAGKRGPRGPRGKQGPMGPAGPAGPQGPAGAKGATGTAGKNGADGKDGVSVTSEEFGTGGKDGKCVGLGGSKFVASSGNTYACNGKEGKAGKDGPPGPVTGELPAGASLSGVWLTPFVSEAQALMQVSISFGLRVDPAPELHYINDEGEEVIHNPVSESMESLPPGPECAGSAAAPSAEEGHLCIYAQIDGALGAGPVGGELSPFSSPDPKSGATIAFLVEPFGLAKGSWAVTAS